VSKRAKSGKSGVFDYVKTSFTRNKSSFTAPLPADFQAFLRNNVKHVKHLFTKRAFPAALINKT